ncbi:MAG: cell division protein FtsQ/DivIB [Pseudomonadales bacterium]|nr:cell division protein FtsQ/DivIB [Pseudomonadales bacterium]
MRREHDSEKLSRRSRTTTRGASVREPASKKRDGSALVWKTMLAVSASVFMYFFATGCYSLYQNLKNQKIEFVRIEGNLNFVSAQEVKAVVFRFMNQNLLALDLAQIKIDLEKNAWIDSADIRREWPDTMIIDVVEEKPIARWGMEEILSRKGRLIRAESVSGLYELPLLTGPDKTEQEVMQQYQKFSQLLYPLGLRVNSLDLNSRGAWQIVLDNGVVIKMGKNKVMDKMRRLVAFMNSSFSDKVKNAEYIDLRYANGISVRSEKNTAEEVVLR